MSTTAAWGAAAIIAARHERRWLAIALCVPIALTAVATQVQGLHWITDVLAGTLLGAAAALAAATLLRDQRHAQEQIASPR